MKLLAILLTTITLLFASETFAKTNANKKNYKKQNYSDRYDYYDGNWGCPSYYYDRNYKRNRSSRNGRKWRQRRNGRRYDRYYRGGCCW